MSMKTWRAEFYPIRASECPKEEAVQHSLRKWEGLRAAALERHGLTWDGPSIVEPASLGQRVAITSSTCSLCVHYFNHRLPIYEDLKEQGGSVHACSTCPLAIARDGVPCDTPRPSPGEEYRSPYVAGISLSHDPEPMIRWLKAALEHEEK